MEGIETPADEAALIERMPGIDKMVDAFGKRDLVDLAEGIAELRRSQDDHVTEGPRHELALSLEAAIQLAALRENKQEEEQ